MTFYESFENLKASFVEFVFEFANETKLIKLIDWINKGGL